MWQGLGEAWSALGTLMSGILVWGGVGWVIDRFAGTRPVFFVVGAVVGNFAAVYLIYMKSFQGVDVRGKGATRDAA